MDKVKIVIMAGGLPSAVAEEDERIPKPMAEIGGYPILWHIMKQFSEYGYSDFIICTGYKGNVIKEYFLDYYIFQSDITVDLQSNQVNIHKKQTEDWKVTIVDTGRDAALVERIMKVQDVIGNSDFIVTYGDCVSDVNIGDVVKHFYEKKALVTEVLAKPLGRYENIFVDEAGNIDTKEDKSASWVNACISMYDHDIFKFISENNICIKESLEKSLMGYTDIDTYCHNGFWSPMETKRDQVYLERLWNSGKAPWKVWEDK